MLRKTLVGGLLLLVSIAANAQFKGGVDDGTHVGQSSSQQLGRNIFLGGSDDGTAFSLTASQPVGRNIFLGGSDDGISSSHTATQDFGRFISLGGSSDGWAMALSGGASVPLPVTLTDFGGRWQQNDALLHWQTASEINTSHFELERSFDGTTFASIQRVAAAGQSTSTKNYQYLDVNINKLLPAGAAYIYYRLRSVDLNGTALSRAWWC